MSRDKALILILLTAVLVSGRAYCQEIRTIVGKVTKIDSEGGVINVKAGTVTKQAFSDAHLDADLVWEELVKNNYIDPNGMIQAEFYSLDKFSSMLLPKKLNAKKKVIYNIFQKALAENRPKVFYISLNSNLLQGAHYMSSIEIEPGDPVTIQYNRSAVGRNNVISLVDNRSSDDAQSF